MLGLDGSAIVGTWVDQWQVLSPAWVAGSSSLLAAQDEGRHTEKHQERHYKRQDSTNKPRHCGPAIRRGPGSSPRVADPTEHDGEDRGGSRGALLKMDAPRRFEARPET